MLACLVQKLIPQHATLHQTFFYQPSNNLKIHQHVCSRLARNHFVLLSIVRHLLTLLPFPPSPNHFFYPRTIWKRPPNKSCIHMPYAAPPSKSRRYRSGIGSLELELKSIWVFFTYSRHVYGNKPQKVFLRSIEASRRFAWRAAAPPAPAPAPCGAGI